MNRAGQKLLFVGVVLFTWIASQREQKGMAMSVETSRLRFSMDVSGATPMVSLCGMPGHREWLASATDQPFFRIVLEGGEGTSILTAADADRVEATSTEDGFHAVWSHFYAWDIRVRISVGKSLNNEGIVTRITIENPSVLAIERVEYPILILRPPPDEKNSEEAILIPRHEGVLLKNPHRHFDEVRQFEKDRYPGHAGFQFMAFYDQEGGLYLASHDGEGYPKEFCVNRTHQGLELSIAHLGYEEPGKTWSRPYPAVLNTFSGDWMAAADLYRGWSRNQEWCLKKITERDIPSWLRDGIGFFNYPAEEFAQSGRRMPFFPPEKAAEGLGRLSETLGVPFVATPFSWEKNGAWIGPDYFPPRGGTEAYRLLAESLHREGNRFFVFLSGFRWGLAKPGTGFDGRRAFRQSGEPLAARNQQGEIIYDSRPWAENALLCVGCREARQLLAEEFAEAYALGLDAVQLDQDVGGAACVCFANHHGHPPGPGLWQGRSMSGFLEHVRQEARKRNPERILTLEEPCELFIPHLDAYHGRAFTYDHWPAMGRGAVSAPVFVYLYHPYLMGYAGWTGGGFDFENNVRLSIGRAFIYGMLVGVRASVWAHHQSESGKSPTALEMWRQAIRLQKRCSEALLWGDMARPPRLKGITTRTIEGRSSFGGKPRATLHIDSVQATTWVTETGITYYALANVKDSTAEMEIGVSPQAANARPGRYEVTRITEEGEERIDSGIDPPAWVSLVLAPYELACLRLDRMQ